MTDRYSDPSRGLGVNRFHVWPAGSDSYDHAENQANWDFADAIIGVPSTGNWPPTTGIDGGIYGEVKRLQNDRVPIGTVIAWFRPDHGTQIPTTWHVADGSVLTYNADPTLTHHMFPGITTSVTLPDMRNKFILGANDTLGTGTAAVAVSSGNIDTAAGAPGAQAVAGSNKIVQTSSQMPSHTHTFTGTPLGTHWHYSIQDEFTLDSHFLGTNTLIGGGSRKAISDIGGLTGATDYNVSKPFHTSSDSAGTPAGANSSTGSGSPMDNRPSYIGLIFLVKVLYSTTPTP